jgi:hypothetical protein
VSYEATSSGLAFGLVRRFAVIGSEAGLRGVIDTTQGGTPLSSSGSYAKMTGHAPPEALAHLYANPTALPAERTGGSSILYTLTGRRPAYISLLANAGSLSLDIDTVATPGTTGGLLTPDPQAAQALAQLPGESWLAVGVGHAGRSLAADVEGLRGLGTLLGGEEAGASIGIASLLKGLTTPLQILGAPTAAARRDFTGWMGSAGIFAAGASLLELKAAVVIGSSDVARSRAAVAKLGAALRARGEGVSRVTIPGAETALAARISGLPVVLDIAAGRGSDGQPRFVLGLGEASVQAALAPPSTLASAPALSAAAQALGENAPPSVIADFPTLLGLLDGVGLTESPAIRAVLPTLRAATTLSGGSRSLGGEVERFRLVVGLRPAP